MASKKFTIRHATVDDLPKIPDVERSASQAFRSIPGLSWLASADVLTVDELKEMLQAGRGIGVFVAIAQDEPFDRIIGFLASHHLDLDYAFVAEMSVASGWQGVGVGSALLRFLFSHVAKTMPSKTVRVSLTTFRDVPWNAPFYVKRHGFVEVADPAELGPEHVERMRFEREDLKLEKDGWKRSCYIRVIESS